MYDYLLNNEQKGILSECKSLQNGGMSIPMGGGKTLLALVLGIEYSQGSTGNPFLVIVSKTLITSWKIEI